jgi:glucose-6-phosphate 1-dehydrogenase
MIGDGALFTREDAVDAAWAVVDPLLKTHHRVRPYRRGTWGPKEADAIIASDGGWHNPASDGCQIKHSATSYGDGQSQRL